MPTFVYSAIVASFVLVRLVKGPWTSNVQFVVAGIVGAMLAALAGDYLYPGTTDDVILRYMVSLCGGGFGIYLFGKAAD